MNISDAGKVLTCQKRKTAFVLYNQISVIIPTFPGTSPSCVAADGLSTGEHSFKLSGTAKAEQ